MTLKKYQGKDVTVFSKLTAEQANQWLADRTKSYKVAEEGYRCPTCDAIIMQTTLYVSLHDILFGDSCAGWGEVKAVNFPYCPICDGVPEIVRGCIHV